MNAPRPPLMTLEQALERVLQQAVSLERHETVPTLAADHRVLAEDVISELHVPPVDNSAMDGYALRAADAAKPPTTLSVTQRIAAGSAPTTLAAGSAARIFTGAPIPEGADAVVMQEDCDVPGDGQVRVKAAPTAGQWVRRAGSDVARGARILSRGERLHAAALGLAASVGRAELLVAARPRVALFSTGDELVMPGQLAPQEMAPGAIYNSNRFFLTALLQRLGCSVTDMGIVPDQRQATCDVLERAARGHDLILTSGGVSVGEEDHIKPAVQSLGELNLWQIAIKPGKPFACGRVGQAHFIGLPGNPVSSFVTFLLLVRPFVLALQGCRQLAAPAQWLAAEFEWPRADRRQEFLRVRRSAAGGLELFPNQTSNVLTSAVWGDGLVDNPPGKTIQRGDLVRFLAFSDLTT